MQCGKPAVIGGESDARPSLRARLKGQWCTACVLCPNADTSGGKIMQRNVMTTAALGFVLIISSFAYANAAEIKIISGNALKTVLEELTPAFEKATGHKLVVIWGGSVPLKAQIEKGEAFDLALLTATGIDDLIKQGKLVPATRTNLATSGAGVAVRKGAPKPDISGVEAFKRALLDAKAVAYVGQGSTGIYLKELLPRLGIADALKDKIKLLPLGNPVALDIANGEAEIGMTQISEILPYAGAELVGPFPAEIQLKTFFATAVATNAKEPQPAKALIKFLTAPAAAPVFKAKGLDPAE
jgi:molybdate transport system substrate-binding protein